MRNIIVFIIFLVPLSVIGQHISFPFQDSSLTIERRADDLLQRLTLSEKISQMQDVSPAIPRLGIPEYNWWNESLHGVARAGAATSFPQAIGMAATFNPELIQKVADAISTEARAKFNHSVSLGQRNRYQGLTMWTPNINIFRDPRWGRGQETYGEDPYLTSKMGVAFVKGLQGDDPNYFKVIATPKHYAVHSGPEYNRHSFDAYTDKRDLWETYLPAFKATIIEGKAFSIMSAYNRYLGESATASTLLLEDILRNQWGFEGYVVSDCGAVKDIYTDHKIVATAEEAAALAVKSGCDLNCGSTYSHLEKSVEKGLITEQEIDSSLKRLLTARIRLGLLNTTENMPFSDFNKDRIESKSHQELALKTARESLVLLKNKNNVLPLSKKTKEITVVGPNANDRHFMLGNYFGTPTHNQTILESIKEKVSKDTKVHYFKGTNIADSEPVFNTIEPEFFDGAINTEYFENSKLEGQPVFTNKIDYIDFDWGGAAPIDVVKPGSFSIRYSGVIKPDYSGEISLGVIEGGGSFKLFIQDQLIVEGADGFGTQIKSNSLRLEKGKRYPFVLEYQCTNPWFASIQLSWNIEHLKGDQALFTAVKNSDAVIYVGGITARLEGEEMPVAIEGFYKGDRTNLDLPKAQQTFIKNLHKFGKPVVLVLTTGSALAINWEDEHLPAILNAWYPGQAGGQAIADVLFGDYNPSGKLPVTFYKSVNDLPPFEDYHMKGRTYRYFGGDVLYPFGYGLSYSDFTYSKPKLQKSVMTKNETNVVEVTVTNNGNFDGETVVQLYINDKEASVTTPLKSLKSFKRLFLKKGTSKSLQFEISSDDLMIVDNDGHLFLEAGEFEIFIGTDSATLNKALLIVQ